MKSTIDHSYLLTEACKALTLAIKANTGKRDITIIAKKSATLYAVNRSMVRK
jgi:hypothetical protein